MATTLAALLVAAVFIAGAATVQWQNLYVKYSPSRYEGYYKMPLTVAASAGEYVKMGRDDHMNVDFYTYPNDLRVAVMYDSHGFIAGLRISYIKADLAMKTKPKDLPFPYSFFNKSMYTYTQYWGTHLWHTDVLFVSPEKLQSGGREDTDGLVAEDVFLKLDGKWTNISRDECQVEAQGFTKQGCQSGIGMHYFYKLTPASKCEDLQLYALIYEGGELVGLAFHAFGAFSSLQRVWFEDTTVDFASAVAPNGPACVTDWINKYRANSFYIFFKRFPRFTFCTWPWQQSDQCKNETNIATNDTATINTHYDAHATTVKP